MSFLFAKVEKGGLGNLRYKSSTNRSPTKFTEGKLGESLSLRLELRLLADIGLLGKPNAGKSSLVRQSLVQNLKLQTMLSPHSIPV